MSYRDFLRDVVKAGPAAIAVYQARSHGEWGVGADAVSALDVWTFDFPGFQGLKLEPGPAPHMGYTASGYADGGSYTFHFPDGNASLARLLVRNLIPESLPGTSAEDVVTARLDYARLDRAQAPVRIRLNATAVCVDHGGDRASANDVEIVYARGGTLSSVRARACVLACYNKRRVSLPLNPPYFKSIFPQHRNVGEIGEGRLRLTAAYSTISIPTSLGKIGKISQGVKRAALEYAHGADQFT
jgi:spermidine dehydrogenase